LLILCHRLSIPISNAFLLTTTLSPSGGTRIADRLCEVIRVVARDGTRYSYIVWMDTESKLPMRVESP